MLLEDFELKQPSTKEVARVFKQCGATSLLLVTDKRDDNLLRSANNISAVKVVPVSGLNVYDLLKYEKVAVFQSAVDDLQEFCCVTGQTTGKEK